MKHYSSACVLLVLSLSLTFSAYGQRGGGGGVGSRNKGPSMPPGPAPGAANFFVSGKVMVDDSTALTEPAAIQTICRGVKRTVSHTDYRGNFSFELGGRAELSSGGLGDADTSWSDTSTQRSPQRWDFRDCDLQAVLAGFTSDTIQFGSKLSFSQTVDVGSITLHRMEKIEGLTISATSAAAPHDAQKAFERGMDQERKQKWDEAEKMFAKAVEIYPRYAVAWYELGRAQAQRNDVPAAQHSYQQAMAIDTQLASPYRGLAQLAAHARQWEEVLQLTTKLLALNPVSFPDAWFLNGVANFNLHKVEEAEKSLRQGLKLDEDHQIPRMEFLLGMILVEKQKYDEAATHLRAFVSMSSDSSEHAQAQKMLADITSGSTTASVAPATDKK